MSVLTAAASPRVTQRYQLESGLEQMIPPERAAWGRDPVRKC